MRARSYLRWRQCVDRALALVLLIITAPILCGVAIAIRVSLGQPVFFRQERVGQYGRRFSIVKFRTMVSNAEQLGRGYMPAELQLVPPLGAFLRKTSLDELPQLLNILRGEMSFVGPRPVLPDQFRRYTPEQERRVVVPQGLTGLAQVRYRNEAPWSVRIESDLEYVDRVSLRLDAAIWAATVRRVLRADGVRLDQVAADVDDLGEAERSGRDDPPPQSPSTTNRKV
ncbi:sugar transferase [Microbacterium sp. I2]|uniref:sugar transferase n=1 Tax=Microbacterium sp. I2 TaxID=3391826 RepID=UPI003ED9CD21